MGILRPSSIGLLLAIGALAPSPAKADKVLVFHSQVGDTTNLGGDLAGPNAAGYLRGKGHDVTLIASIGATLPTDLSQYDSVWVIQLVPLGLNENVLVDYVVRGGGLYLTGERAPCCDNQINASVQNVHNRLIPTITNFVQQLETGDDFVRGTDTFGITRTPNDLPTFLGGAAGAIQKTLPHKHQVYVKKGGDQPVMGAWTGEDMKAAGGCMIINMDLSFWFDDIHPEQDRAKLAENLERFLATCNDRDHDGASDGAETLAGTDPDDPDTDNDGLCDGYGRVAGVCIPGENLYANFDGDSLIDPLDPDDDNDTLPTSFEVKAELAKPNADDYNDPAWLDIDSDKNNILDRVEGYADFDKDGIPAIVDLGDDPENCRQDSDCLVQSPTAVCDLEARFCHDPAAGPGGDAGTSGTGGTSSNGGSGGGGGADASAGGTTEVDGGEGDGGRNEEGSGGRSSASSGGKGNSQPGAIDAGEDGGDARRNLRRSQDSGCNCSVPGRESNAGLPLAALLGAIAFARRWRRRGSTVSPSRASGSSGCS